MNPDYLRHNRPELPDRGEAVDRRGERRGGVAAGVAAGVAVLVGIVPFIVVLQGFFVAMAHGYAWWAVLCGAALVAPVALSAAFGWRTPESSGESGPSGAAFGLWLGVLLLALACLPVLNMEIFSGLGGPPVTGDTP